MIKLVVFDFDGTIADTLEPTIHIYNRLAPFFRTKKIQRSELDRVRGEKPKRLLWEYGVGPVKLLLLTLTIRRFLKKQIATIPLQSGIAEALFALQSKGVRLQILTSNSKENVSTFLRIHHLDHFFETITSYRRIFGKDIALKQIAQDAWLQVTEIAYVGDEVRDMEAAKRAGVKSVAASWGFQTYEALEKCRPDILLRAPEELPDSIL